MVNTTIRPPPFDPENPVVYTDTRDRNLAAMVTGLAAATATTVTHYGLTVLITIRVLRKAIEAFSEANVKLLGAVNASNMTGDKKQAIKAKLDIIGVNTDALLDKINSAKERKTRLEAIKTQLEDIKTALGDRLSTEYANFWGTYIGAEVAYRNADRMKIGQQALIAGGVVGAVAGVGSMYARPVQDAITKYVDNLRSGVGGKVKPVKA